MPELLFTASSAEAQAEAPKVKVSPLPPDLTKVIERYQQARSLAIRLQKTVTIAAIDKKKAPQEGRVFIDRNNFRLEFDEPGRSAVVGDSKQIWFINYLSEKLGGGMQVAKADRQSARHPPLVMKLLSHRLPKDEFGLVKAAKMASGQRFELVPHKKSSDLVRLEIETDSAKREITKIIYWDELSNETSLKFKGSDFNPKLDAGLFRFVPPKGLKVTDYR